MAKKSFKESVRAKATDNPALQFISQPITAEEPEAEKEATDYQRPGAEERTSAPVGRYGGEAKTRRVQLLLTPSLYDAIRDRAAEERRSVNDTVNILLQDALRN